ncbi:MAG: hypothetical protein HQK53_02195 [Oligoflexia bacterium]|nr:hypothetical protein [Oligoflexia bacterium]
MELPKKKSAALTMPFLFWLALIFQSAFTSFLAEAGQWRGICYTPCRHASAGPAGGVGVYNDLRGLSSFTDTIRTYSISDCGFGENVLEVTRSFGMRVYLGMWIGPWGFGDEYNVLVKLAHQGKLDNVDVIIVGNETQYRNDISEDALIGMMGQVREFLKSVGYGHIKITTGDVRGKWSDRLISASDLVLAHMHPYWEGISIDRSVEEVSKFMLNMRVRLDAMGQSGKVLILGETGWPSKGEFVGAAAPGDVNQGRYYKDLKCAAKNNNFNIFFFEGFDSWHKRGIIESEKYWGLFTGDGNLKMSIARAHAEACPNEGGGGNVPPVVVPSLERVQCRYVSNERKLMISNLPSQVRCVVYPTGSRKQDTWGPVMDFSPASSNDAFVLLFGMKGCESDFLGRIDCQQILKR